MDPVEAAYNFQRDRWIVRQLCRMIFFLIGYQALIPRCFASLSRARRLARPSFNARISPVLLIGTNEVIPKRRYFDRRLGAAGSGR